MTKREFIEACMLRCAPVPGCQPMWNLEFALQQWEALDAHGDKTAAHVRAMLVPASGFTGPSDPRVS
jgi:hypothetical protein